MLDLFQWRSDYWNAERLYFYSTLIRLGYAEDASLWEKLREGIDGIERVTNTPAPHLDAVSMTTVIGQTGSIIVFNGTTNAFQWWGNLALISTAHFDDYPGNVNLHDELIARDLKLDILNHAGGVGRSHITCCGHSFGGAIANLAAHLIHGTYPQKLEGVITEGSKRTGDPAYAQGTTFPVIRIENEIDPIPRLFPPPAILFPIVRLHGIDFGPDFTGVITYEHAGTRLGLDYVGNMIISRGNDMIGQGADVTNPIPGDDVLGVFDHHASAEYTRRLRARLGKLQSPTQLRMMQNRQTLDEINVILNDRLRVRWQWDPTTGLPINSVINPNLPAAECGCSN